MELSNVMLTNSQLSQTLWENHLMTKSMPSWCRLMDSWWCRAITGHGTTDSMELLLTLWTAFYLELDSLLVSLDLSLLTLIDTVMSKLTPLWLSSLQLVKSCMPSFLFQSCKHTKINSRVKSLEFNFLPLLGMEWQLLEGTCSTAKQWESKSEDILPLENGLYLKQAL